MRLARSPLCLNLRLDSSFAPCWATQPITPLTMPMVKNLPPGDILHATAVSSLDLTTTYYSSPIFLEKRSRTWRRVKFSLLKIVNSRHLARACGLRATSNTTLSHCAPLSTRACLVLSATASKSLRQGLLTRSLSLERFQQLGVT